MVALALAALVFIIYRQTRPQRLSAKAQTYLEEQDFAGAALTAQRALQLDPANVGAMRVMAQLHAEQGLESSLDWWEKVVATNRGSAADALAWAKTALDLGDSDAAQRALNAVPEPQRNTAEFKGTAALVALVLGETDEAELLLRDALKLAPDNSEYRLYFAQVQLQNSADEAAGRKLLEELVDDPVVGSTARRALIDDAIERSDFDAALIHARAIAENDATDFEHQLLYLELLLRSAAPEFRDELERKQRQAQENFDQAYHLFAWMLEHGMAADALRWSDSFPGSLKANSQMAVALAEARVATRDWQALSQFTEDADWKNLEALRLAYRARARRELGDDVGFRTGWNAAKSATIKSNELIAAMAEIIEKWGWDQELRELWWEAAQHSSHPDWALSQLNDIYFENGDTAGLRRVAEEMLRRNPSDRTAQNNFAICSLLLDKDLQQALQLSRKLARSDPANALFVSTYAYALHRTGSTEDALKVMNGLKEEQLRQPEIALYYGLLLASDRHTQRAREYLALARRGDLLPEEKQLLAQAESLAAKKTGTVNNL